MKETELAYVAGLFDGEGSVTFGQYKAGGADSKRYPRLMVRITNNDQAVLLWVKDLFGMGRVQCKGPSKARIPTIGYDFVVVTASAVKFLDLIRPYVKIKAENADKKVDLYRSSVTMRTK